MPLNSLFANDDKFDGTVASLLKIQQKDENVCGMKCFSELIYHILRLGYRSKKETIFYHIQDFLMIWMGKFEHHKFDGNKNRNFPN